MQFKCLLWGSRGVNKIYIDILLLQVNLAYLRTSSVGYILHLLTRLCLLPAHYLDQMMNIAEKKTIIRNINRGYRPIRALRAARTKRRVAAGHQD